jgi:hypothetical protein
MAFNNPLAVAFSAPSAPGVAQPATRPNPFGSVPSAPGPVSLAAPRIPRIPLVLLPWVSAGVPLERRNEVSALLGLPPLPAGSVPALDLAFGRIGVPRLPPHAVGLQPRKSCFKKTGRKNLSVRIHHEVRCLVTGAVVPPHPRDRIQWAIEEGFFDDMNPRKARPEIT